MNTDYPRHTGTLWVPFDVLRSLGFTNKQVMHMAGERIGMLRQWRDPQLRHRYLTLRHAKRLRKVAAVLMSSAWGKLSIQLTSAAPEDSATRAQATAAALELNLACMALLGDDVPIWNIDEWLKALADAEAAEEAPRDELCD